MGTLAYDPDQLLLLAARLTTAAEELEALGSSVPDAADALDSAATVAADLRGWAQRIVDLSACDVLGGYQPIALDPASFTVALQRVLAGGYGWRITTDPLGDTWYEPPAMVAAALGRAIAGGRYDIASTAGRDALLAQLGLALSSPEGRAALIANVDMDQLADLTIRLGDEYAVLVTNGGGPDGSAVGGDPGMRAQTGTIHGVAALLATVVVDPTAPLADARAMLARFRPWAAGLLVANLDAPDPFVHALAIDLFARYRPMLDAPDDGAAWWEAPDPAGPGFGELLFPRITQMSPALANGFVQAVGALDWRLLTHTVNTPATTAALLARATDPAAIGVEDAGAVIVPYLAHLRGAPYPAADANIDGLGQAMLQPLAFLGALVAPWMMQFSSRPGDWGWNDEEAYDAFQFVIADETAWHDLLAAADRWGDSMMLLDTGDIGDLQKNLREFATMVGGLGRLFAIRAGDHARAQRGLWDFVVKKLPSVLNKGIGRAGVTGLPAKAVAKITAFAVALGARQAEEHGVPGAPRPLGDVLAEIELDHDETLAFTAYVAMGVKVDALIEAGELPPGTDWPPPPIAGTDECPSGSYIDATDPWLDAIPDDLVRDSIESARGAVIAPGQSEGACVERRFVG